MKINNGYINMGKIYKWLTYAISQDDANVQPSNSDRVQYSLLKLSNTGVVFVVKYIR